MKQVPEPRTFTHNGEPALIDLDRYKPQPQIEQPSTVAAAREPVAERMTFIHNGEPATIDLSRYEQRPVGSEPLTFLHNGAPATINLEQFNAQTPKEKQMKHGEIGAPRNTGDAGVGAVPEVGSMKVVILNGSRQIDKVVPGVGANGSAGWQTQEVLGENGLKKGIYPLYTATDASKKVHPQQFGGQLLHVDKQNVYQFGPDDGKGKSTIVKHDRRIFDQALAGEEPEVGKFYEVSYSRGVGKVKGELTQEEGAKLSNRKVNRI